MNMPFTVFFAMQRCVLASYADAEYTVTDISSDTPTEIWSGEMVAGTETKMTVTPDHVLLIDYEGDSASGSFYFQVPANLDGWGSSDEHLLFWGWVEQEGGARWSSI